MTQTTPRELVARHDLESEWWYYNGFLEAGSRRFGVCVAFFRSKSQRDDVQKSLRPMTRLFFPPHYVPAHFSLTDFDRGEFRYAHRRPIRGCAGASADRYHVWTQDWSASAEGDVHRLHVGMRGAKLDLALVPMKPLVRHGNDGLENKGSGQHGYHYSYTRMQANGTLVLDRRAVEVRGTGWMDREAGNWRPNPQFLGWDWFAIQLDGQREIMLTRAHDERRDTSPVSFACLVDGQHAPRQFSAGQFSLTHHHTWRSPYSGVVYPSGWTLRVPEAELELHIEPVLRCQELDSRGSTMVIYWEGAARVQGHWNGSPATGQAYVELFGYDQSHLHVSLLDWFRGERVRHKTGSGTILRDEQDRVQVRDS